MKMEDKSHFLLETNKKLAETPRVNKLLQTPETGVYDRSSHSPSVFDYESDIEVSRE